MPSYLRSSSSRVCVSLEPLTANEPLVAAAPEPALN